MVQIATAAEFLVSLRADQRQVEAIPVELRPADLNRAYQIQDALVDRLLAQHGGQRIGYKIACTNPVVQQELNIAGPLFGQLLSFSTQSSPATLRTDDFLVRVVEVEFAFRMGTDAVPTATPYTRESIAPLIDVALPGIELVSHRFVDWTQAGAPSVAADNAIHAAWIHGAPFAGWRELDLAQQEVSLTVNGQMVRQGQGAQVLGHPLNVVAWLANELPKHGKLLRSGDSITTGVATEVYLAAAGDQMRADFGVIGSVELMFT